jgi:hypothetical protein
MMPKSYWMESSMRKMKKMLSRVPKWCKVSQWIPLHMDKWNIKKIWLDLNKNCIKSSSKVMKRIIFILMKFHLPWEKSSACLKTFLTM